MRWGLLLLLMSGCGRPDDPPPTGLPAECRQAVVVRPAGAVPRATVSAWHRGGGGGWRRAFADVPATIGRSGFAPAGAKREGDGCTPTGRFALGPAFGYAPACDTRLDYRPVTADDYWIDDPQSPDYNHWVTGAKPTVSHEVLRRDDGDYEYAVVIGYNANPIIAGHGSAIFLHVWGGPGQATAGCVAVSRGDMVKLLAWLDRAQSPVIVLNP